MCELQRTIDNEMKLQEFLGVKGQYREMSDLNAKLKAEKEARREEMRNKIAVYNQILTLVKQFTGKLLAFLFCDDGALKKRKKRKERKNTRRLFVHHRRGGDQ